MRKIGDQAVVLGASMAGLLAARVLADAYERVLVLPRAARVEESLDADLVLDATGRGGRTAAWLSTIGYDQPPQEQLTIHLKYATRHLSLRPGALPGQKFVTIGAEPGRPSGLVLFAEEDDRWILTTIGYDRHHPPTDPDAFLAFVETIAPSDVLAAIRDAEPLDDIVAYRFPANLRRRYERGAPVSSRPPCLRRCDLQHQPGVRPWHVGGHAPGGSPAGDVGRWRP
jgi:hypothetical protein